MYTHLTTPPNIREFTVEDPNEAFDDLRDQCDLRYLRTHNPDFAALRINTAIPTDKLAGSAHIPTDHIIPGEIREHVMRQTKTMPRQFDRLVEMHTLSFIPTLNRSRNRITRREKSSNEHDRAYYFWRLYAKQRLYVHNRDLLLQLEHDERVERLEATLDGVQEGYVKILEKVESQAAGDVKATNGSTTEGTAPPKARKRKVVEDADDDEDEEEAEPVVVNGSGSKKIRVQ